MLQPHSGVESGVASPALKVPHANIGHTICAEDDLSGGEVGGHAYTECECRAEGGGAPCLQSLYLPLDVAG